MPKWKLLLQLSYRESVLVSSSDIMFLTSLREYSRNLAL